MKINISLILKIDKILLLLTLALIFLFFIYGGWFADRFYNDKKVDYILNMVVYIFMPFLFIIYGFQFLKSIYGIFMLIIYRKKIILSKNDINYSPYKIFVVCMLIILIIFIFRVLDFRKTIDTEMFNSEKPYWLIYFCSMIFITIGIPAWLISIKNKIIERGITELTLVATIVNSFFWFFLLTLGD
jgi:hypothetical protein